MRGWIGLLVVSIKPHRSETGKMHCLLRIIFIERPTLVMLASCPKVGGKRHNGVRSDVIYFLAEAAKCACMIGGRELSARFTLWSCDI